MRGVPSQALARASTASPTARNAAAPADAAPLSGGPSAVPGPDEGRLAGSPGLRLLTNAVCTFPAILSPLLHQTPFAAGAPRFPIVEEASIRVAGLSPPVQAPRCRAGRPGRRARAEASAAARYVPGTGRSQRAIRSLEAEAKAGRGHHWPTATDPAPTAGSAPAERTRHGGCRTRSHSVIPSGPAGCFACPWSVGCPAALGAYGQAGRESEGLAARIASAGRAAPARLRAQHPGHVVRRLHHLPPVDHSTTGLAVVRSPFICSLLGFPRGAAPLGAAAAVFHEERQPTRGTAQPGSCHCRPRFRSWCGPTRLGPAG